MTDEEKIARCKRLVIEIAEHKQAMHDLAVERHRLVCELRGSGFGLRKLAALLGVSGGRIQQLERVGPGR